MASSVAGLGLYGSFGTGLAVIAMMMYCTTVVNAL